jgi:CRP-like cAMP-binding protein
LLEDGRRQIFAFLIPGDMYDLRARLVHRMDYRVAALNHCRIAEIPHRRLFDVIEKYPRVALALWNDTIFDAAIYREWMTNIGRRDAYERLAHLLCEIGFRLQRAGRARGASYDLPVTQTDIGDALGLSVVHVNRTLKRLRTDGLVEMKCNVVSVLDWQPLQEAAKFDPNYMQVEQVRV